MSSTSSEKKGFDLKGRGRKLQLNVKELFTRSRHPSRVATPVPDDSTVGPTQGEEGLSYI